MASGTFTVHRNFLPQPLPLLYCLQRPEEEDEEEPGDSEALDGREGPLCSLGNGDIPGPTSNHALQPWRGGYSKPLEGSQLPRFPRNFPRSDTSCLALLG